MSLTGYILGESKFTKARGPQSTDPDTGSSFQVPVSYNVEIPTGSAERTYVKGNMSVTVIDPNGEGTCKPRLVATGSFNYTIINDNQADAVAPFTDTAANLQDVADLLDFFKALNITQTLPDPNGVGPQP